MSDPSNADLRANVRASWEERAPAWNKWADHMEKMARTMNQPLLAAADLQPGQKVLDLASGQGQPAFSVAEVVGPSGHVTASDFVEDMLDGLRQRLTRKGLENVSVEQADMENLPYDDASFDRVTCRFGLMFTPSPVAALSEVRRVLRPGGLAAFMVWGELEDVTMFKVIGAAIEDIINNSPGTISPFTPFRLGARGTLQGLFQDAGFTEISEQEVKFEPKIKVEVPFWQANLEMRLGPRLKNISTEEFEALNRKIRLAFEPYRNGDVFELSSLVRVGTGRT